MTCLRVTSEMQNILRSYPVHVWDQVLAPVNKRIRGIITDAVATRPDEGRFVLVEGLHRFEACKALGEKTIIGVSVSAEITHQKTLFSDRAEAERDKMARLKRLRLEKEAAERLAAASTAVMENQSDRPRREHSQRSFQDNLKDLRRRSNRGTLGTTPRSLSEWLTQQKRDGGHY